MASPPGISGCPAWSMARAWSWLARVLMAARFPRIWVRVLSLSLTASSPLGLGVILWGAGRVGRVAVGVCVVGVLFVAQIGFSGFGGAGELGADRGDLGLQVGAVSGPCAGGRRPRGGATVAEAAGQPLAAEIARLVDSWQARCRAARGGVGGPPAGRGRVADRGWGVEARVARGPDHGGGNFPGFEVVHFAERGEYPGGIPAGRAGWSGGDGDDCDCFGGGFVDGH